MITFSVAMMIMVPNAIAAYKGGQVNSEVNGWLFVMTAVFDLMIVETIFK